MGQSAVATRECASARKTCEGLAAISAWRTSSLAVVAWTTACDARAQLPVQDCAPLVVSANVWTELGESCARFVLTTSSVILPRVAASGAVAQMELSRERFATG